MLGAVAAVQHVPSARRVPGQRGPSALAGERFL